MSIEHIRVISKRDGFRRAGLVHSGGAVFHKKADLTKEQIEALKGEPMLIVDEMDPPGIETEKAPPAGKGDKPPAGGAKEKDPPKE